MERNSFFPDLEPLSPEVIDIAERPRYPGTMLKEKLGSIPLTRDTKPKQLELQDRAGMGDEFP